MPNGEVQKAVETLSGNVFTTIQKGANCTMKMETTVEKDQLGQKFLVIDLKEGKSFEGKAIYKRIE